MLVKKLNKNLIIAWLVTIILLAGVVTLGCVEQKPLTIPTTTPIPQTPTPEPTPPPGIYPVSAWYRVDNGPEQKLYSPGFRWVEGGIRITWLFDPIPSDARETTFVITKVGEQTGPWESRISLVD